MDKNDLQIIATKLNLQDDDLSKLCDHQKISTTAEIVNDISHNDLLDLPIKTKADTELERRLREIKFQQELRKDWILFLVKDVIVYSATVIFIFIFVSFYLFNIIFPG
jgi:hypothetical protein